MFSEKHIMGENDCARSDFENALWHFVDSLRVASYPSEEQCKEIGGYNVAYELALDLTDEGAILVNAASGFLSASQVQAINCFIGLVMALPPGALSGQNGVIADHDECMMVLNHQLWDLVRTHAAALLCVLDNAIKRNDIYYGQ